LNAVIPVKLVFVKTGNGNPEDYLKIKFPLEFTLTKMGAGIKNNKEG